MCEAKWARSLFWGPSGGAAATVGHHNWMSVPRTDQFGENIYRTRLFYEISTKIHPNTSRRMRIVGGDVVPGVGIVHKTHPSFDMNPSINPINRRLTTPPPREYYKTAVTKAWRPDGYKLARTNSFGCPSPASIRRDRSGSPSLCPPSYNRQVLYPRERRQPIVLTQRSSSTSRLAYNNRH